jgi:hypothetical protein
LRPFSAGSPPLGLPRLLARDGDVIHAESANPDGTPAAPRSRSATAHLFVAVVLGVPAVEWRLMLGPASSKHLIAGTPPSPEIIRTAGENPTVQDGFTRRRADAPPLLGANAYTSDAALNRASASRDWTTIASAVRRWSLDASSEAVACAR